jgi:multidrug efflux pump subunit AcrA (membrane-fusion protein)
MKVGKWIRDAAVAVALGAAALAVWAGVQALVQSSASSPAGRSSLFTVTRRDLHIALEESGTLMARSAERIVPGIERMIRVTYIAPEGTLVRKGDVVARIAVPDLDQDILRMERSLTEAIGDYRLAVVDLEIEREDARVGGAKASTAYAEARNELRKFTEIEAALEERRRAIRVDESRARLARARERLRTLPGYLQEGFAAPDALAQAQMEVRRAEHALWQAGENLRLYRTFEQPMGAARKRIDVTRKKSELEASRKRGDVRVKHHAMRLLGLRREIERMHEEWERLVSYKKRTVLKAPREGLVIHGDLTERLFDDEMVVYSEGGTWGDETLLTLPDLGALYVLLQIPQDRIYMLRTGMEARVRVAGKGREHLRGRIVRIAELAAASNWRTEELAFEVEVSLDDSAETLKPNSTVKVDIEIDRLRSVLAVPLHAIHRRKGRTFCTVAGPAGPLAAEVKTGRKGRFFVEVKSGLREGERIHLGRGHESTPGGKEDR